MTETPATTIDIRDLANALRSALPRLDETDQQIAIATYRLLARGRPASAKEIAVAAGVTPADVEERLGAWPAVFRDGEGLVVGFWGLTVAEMPPHELLVRDVRLWAWCAWDTLFLPARLGAVIEVRSVCPVTNETVELRVAPDHVESASPGGIVVSFLSPERRFDGNVITSFCHFVHFVASRRAGEQWIERHPGTFLLSLPDAVELARLSNLTLALAIP
jgi:alkylmercury lyase